MPSIPFTPIPDTYRAQSKDTSREIDWPMFERLRQLSLTERMERYCTFNTSTRSNFGINLTQAQTCAESARRRLGTNWIPRLKYPQAEVIIIDPISFTRKVVAILDRLHIPYYVSGSFASAVYGESRNTRDIDLVVEITHPHVKPIVNAFLAADFYISETAVSEAINDPDPRQSFDVLDNRSVEKADLFVLKNESFAQSKMQRRRSLALLGTPIYVCSPEDIVLRKMIWRSDTDSAHQWQDILGVLKLQQSALDQTYLICWADYLGVIDELEQAKQESGL